MTIEEWAGLLSSLRRDDESRRDALLMLSDEDWVCEQDREWLRTAALRETPLRPCNEMTWTFDSFDWASDGNIIAIIPKSVARRLKREEHDAKDYTRPYIDAAYAWLDLLQALSRS